MVVTQGILQFAIIVENTYTLFNNFLIIMHFLYYIGETATTQMQNEFDGELRVQCSDKQGFVGVVSQYSKRLEDRQWKWKCQKVAKRAFTKCYWTDDWVNNYDEPFLFQCPANNILTGVQSIHHNSYEDRRFKFRCCRAKNHFTRNCFASSYINDWHQMMDYKVDRPYVFTGVYSYHSNKNE